MAKDTRAPKTRIRAKTLLGAVKDVAAAVQAKTTIPILSNVLISAGDGLLTLTGTDLDVQAVRECATDDRDGPGSKEWLESIRPFAVCLPAKALLALLGELDGDAMVTIAAEDDATASAPGRVTISAGRARFRLHSAATADFPRLTPSDWEHSFEIKASVLADAFARVGHAISTEETRYYLNGVFVHPVDSDLRLATTDGKRLARLALDAPVGAATWPAMIVGRVSVGVLDKLLGAAEKADEGAMVEIETNPTGSMLSLRMPAADGGSIELTAKAIDGTYPDYQRVIPSSSPRELRVNRHTLAEVAKRVGALADAKSRVLKFEIEPDLIRVTASTLDIGEASEELPCSYDGDAVTLGLDGKYLREALGAIGADDVVMRFDDAAGPVRLEASSSAQDAPRLTQVVMPVHV
ncbi:DNA polymerase III subunit beta [Novosphingobium olei]|uniref:DNA polymerase III subunit beta n=1 Tax=Novosphingobium olei TaxID=2728851 RepID=UPI00308F3BA1|nr:DNA polymerase III subunit beta [Novosphingobium olei]